jgi:hypothetical protein
MHRTVVWFLVAALALVACTDDAPPDDESAVADDPAGTEGQEDQPTDAATDDTEQCRQDGLEDAAVVTLTGDDPVAISTEVAARTHRCAPVVVVAPTGGWEALLAVPVARAADAPLLLVDPAASSAIAASLDTLAVDEIVAVGTPLDGLERPGTELLDAGTPGAGDDATEEASTDEATEEAATEEAATDETATDETATDEASKAGAPAAARLAVEVAAHLDVDRFLGVPFGDEHARLAAAHRTDGTAALLPLPDDRAALTELAASLPSTAVVTVLASEDPEGLADELVAVGIDAQPDDAALWPSAADTTTWLADPTQPAVAAVTAVAAGGRDESLLPVDASDLRAGDDARRLRELAPDQLVLVGEVTEDADWQVETVLTGPTLPGGGHRLFENERMVAIYGHPGSTVLGALGEQDLDGAVERAREVAAPYDADGAEVLPTFEIITTIASAEPGARGDYSRRTDPEVLRPWVDRAAEEGFYVVLDLQPGRTDFLEQAQEYEELLREPHVGLALDPEWRLEPDQVHLRQIGNVQAEEVQRVADWLAALTREHRLPQKALVLHQFRLAMLPDRDTIVTPPELAIVVHMDGQGAIEDKYATYDLITEGAEDRWVWGWKNFYDEDLPTPTPQEVLALDPLPWFVSYQ